MLRNRSGKMRYIFAVCTAACLLFASTAIAGTFTELQLIISDDTTGKIVLSEDYTYDDADAALVSRDGGQTTHGILISKDIEIDGNGKTISGAGKMRVLLIDAASAGSSGVVIKNLTITKGGNMKSGPGVYIAKDNKVSFEKTTIKENGTISGTHTQDGGSIFIDSKATVSFDDCDITGNIGADRAAGIYTRGTVTITNSRITNNIGGSRGGGIYVDPGTGSQRGDEWGGNLTIKNSVLTGNKGGRGGAIYINSENDTLNLIENCIIKNNDVSANNVGNGGGMVFYNCNAKLVSCDISDNKAKRGGGFIVDVETDIIVDRCIVTGNSVIGERSADQNIGGGILCHDGSHSDDTMKPFGVFTLKDSVVLGNVHYEDIADDINIHWSVNDDKSTDVDPSWTARYDGYIISEGGNAIGTLVNPKNFTRADDDAILETAYDLPDGHPDLPRGGSGSSGCSTGAAIVSLAALALLPRREK